MNVYDEQHDDEREFWSDEPTRRITRPTVSLRSVTSRSEHIGANPFVARIGLLVAAGLVAIALVWSVKVTVGSERVTADPAAATLVPATVPTTVAAPEVAASPVTEPPSTAAATTASTAAPVSVAPTTAAPQARAAAAAAQPATPPAVEAASSGVAAVPAAAPVCKAATYTIKRGDAWILIAKKVKVSTKDLLAANRATARTPLYPGRTVCLPGYATLPAAAPATTAPRAAAIAQQPAAAPRATVAQTPPPPPPPTAAPANRAFSQAEAVAIIREIWPDELEEKALAVAWRESNHTHTARNYCCHGLFQIYFNVHKGWLKDLGITSTGHLYDPYLNARAALTLYVRAGGWGPWGG